MKTFVFKRAEGLDLRLDLHGAEEGRAKPTLVFIHGGALIMGSRDGLADEQRELYLSAGFAVAAIDYRLAPETKLEGIIQDLRDAFGWLGREGAARGVDGGRLGVVGHSAGGYLTLMSGFCARPKPKALVSFYGYGDIAGEWYAKPDPFYSAQPKVERADALATVGTAPLTEEPRKSQRFKFYLYCRQNGRWPLEVSGRDPAKEPDYFTQFCPARNVARDYPPTLLLHGDSDTDVPYAQSVQMAAALEKAGVERELVTIPHGPHGFDRSDGGLKSAQNRQAFDRVLDFLRKRV